MIDEHILNSFISSNLTSLGLEHVNSEVPKPVKERRRKKTDILAFDTGSSIPVVLELKVRPNPDVLSQLHDYLELITNQYPTLFEELIDYRQLKNFKFNYRYGIVGIVLSPEPPPHSIPQLNTTVLWAQFLLNDNRSFQIVTRRLLSKSSDLDHRFGKRSHVSVRPSAIVASHLPNLREFAELLDETFLSVSSIIYPRYSPNNGYIAYYGRDTRRSRSVFGFNTGSSRSDFKVQFHIPLPIQTEFRSHPAIKELKSIGFSFGPAAIKPTILETTMTEAYAANKQQVSHCLRSFKSLADFSYSVARVQEIQSISITQDSLNGLSLDKFGL